MLIETPFKRCKTRTIMRKMRYGKDQGWPNHGCPSQHHVPRVWILTSR